MPARLDSRPVANGYLDRLPTYITMQPCQAATKGVPLATLKVLKKAPRRFINWVSTPGLSPVHFSNCRCCTSSRMIPSGSRK